ncbi:hypothetical protein C8034_v006403 [Colletotrichum sidae]|uniref:Uncharacterized protein n=1 Tax=Colletotrichum sidae TaxID=1347389 RepID=A0A4R8T5G0_9PEZI|nr:hypothetical protein C8034_v006403 [Colletotrichum sidae]
MERGQPPKKAPAALSKAPSLKRDFTTYSKDGDGTGPGESGSSKKKQPKEDRPFYTQQEVEAALRPELVASGPQRIIAIIMDTMTKTKEAKGRILSNEPNFVNVKKAAKKGESQGIGSYLKADVCIRMLKWNPSSLQDFFDRAGDYEHRFRTTYWVLNQKTKGDEVKKLASQVAKPNIHHATHVADEIYEAAKDIVGRSVFVPNGGHPITRSAVAIMLLAQSKEKPENSDDIIQIWAAWCITKGSGNDEPGLFATLVLSRLKVSNRIKQCFQSLTPELRGLAQNSNKDKYIKWKQLHGRCHIIPINELKARDRADEVFQSNGLYKGTAKTTSNSEQQAHTPARGQFQGSPAGPKSQKKLGTSIGKATKSAEGIRRSASNTFQPKPQATPHVQQRSVVQHHAHSDSLFVSSPSTQASQIEPEIPLDDAQPATMGAVRQEMHDRIGAVVRNVESRSRLTNEAVQTMGNRNMVIERRLRAQEDQSQEAREREVSYLNQIQELQKDVDRLKAVVESTHKPTQAPLSARETPGIRGVPVVPGERANGRTPPDRTTERSAERPQDRLQGRSDIRSPRRPLDRPQDRREGRFDARPLDRPGDRTPRHSLARLPDRLQGPSEGHAQSRYDALSFDRPGDRTPRRSLDRPQGRREGRFDAGSFDRPGDRTTSHSLARLPDRLQGPSEGHVQSRYDALSFDRSGDRASRRSLDRPQDRSRDPRYR